MAPAMRKVPASMRSGLMRWRAPCKLCDALNANGGCAGAFDLCAHRGQQRGEVGHFRLAGAVFQEGLAFGEDGGHEQVFGAGDGDLVEDEVRAFEAVGAGFEIAMLLDDRRAHCFEAFDMQVDGAAADGASSGHGDAGDAGARDKRAEDQRTGAHGLDDFVFGDRVGEVRQLIGCGAAARP